jgi:hypothetical protein
MTLGMARNCDRALQGAGHDSELELEAGYPMSMIDWRISQGHATSSYSRDIIFPSAATTRLD